MKSEVSYYNENGYVILDNFLPEDTAIELNKIFKSQEKWEKIDQVRDGHYNHVFSTKSPFLPKGDESYMAKFARAQELEKQERVNKIYDQYFKPKLKEFSGVDLQEFDVRCYKLQQGDFYRTHIDDYAGSIGCVYYINQKWVFDWGGLLHIAFDNNIDHVETVFPKFNRAIFLDHKKFKFPHFVSAISQFAKESRYSIVSFNG